MGTFAHSADSDEKTNIETFHQGLHCSDLAEKKYDYVVCTQQRYWPVCVSAQSDKHICYLLQAKNHITACLIQNFNIQANLCS